MTDARIERNPPMSPGLPETTRRPKIDFLEAYDAGSIVEELRRIARLTGRKTVTKDDIANHGRMSYAVVNKRFGSLRRALEAAGLKPRRFMKASEDELLRTLVELWMRTLKDTGRRPERRDLRHYGYAVSSDTFVRRFGTWKKALLKAYNSIDEADADPNVQPVTGDAEVPKASPRHAGPHRKRRSLSLRKRFFILKRDSFACRRCGRSGPGVKLEVDHIVPFAQGGSDSPDNLHTLCFDCNRGKRDDLE
jgi:5-methylcytosine-specific restriction endonuclease McrA